MSSIPADPSKRVLVIGPTPPPYNGMTTAIEAIMRSNLNDRFQLIHLDSADRRGIANIGTLDFWNIWLALRHSLELLFLLARYRPHVLYIPIAQAPLGYLRDGLWVTMGRLFHSRVIVHLHGGFFRQFYETSSRPMR